MSGYVVRPIDPLVPWPTRRASDEQRHRSPFSATWTETMRLLERELWHLGVQGQWVMQVDVRESQINRDGTINARATPASPAVRIAFTSARQGPLIFACDRFLRWQDNVRAIALGLESLRRVNRYGISESAEQYRGYQAITNRPNQMTREQAAEFIAHWAGMPATVIGLLLTNPGDLAMAYRAAARRAHPDKPGGDADLMARLNAARDLLAKAA